METNDSVNQSTAASNPYPLGSVVSFTAEQTYEGTRFVCWHLDGEFYSTDLSVDVTTMDDVHVLEAVMLWPGDMDGDADVDLTDFAEFSVCYTGAGVTAPPPGCEPCEFRGADLDGDDDVDLADFATFAVNHGGKTCRPTLLAGKDTCGPVLGRGQAWGLRGRPAVKPLEVSDAHAP